MIRRRRRRWFFPLLTLLLLPHIGARPQCADLSATINKTALHPGDKAVAAVVVDIKPGFHAQSHTPSGDYYIPLEVELDPNDAIVWSKPAYPHGEDHEYPALGKLNVYTGKVVVYVPFEVKSHASPGDLKLSGKITYQLCDDQVCFMPESPTFTIDTKIVAASEPTQPNQPELFSAYDPTAPPPLAAGGSPRAAPLKIFGRDLTSDAYILAFIAAFVVGVIFNVMPCVLPVVPLKAIGFYEVSQHNRARCIAFGAVFSLGLILSFAALGLFVVALRAIDWGELFTIPWFRALIVIVLLAMAVSTFGFFSVNVPTGLYRIAPRHDTYWGNFLFGILTAVLSTPCTFGMFVGLLAWAVNQPAAIGMSLMIMVGVGMAFPYFVLSAFPQLARRLPRSGPWAELVKQMMGFLLLGTAVYFAKPLLEKLISADAFWWLLFAVVAVAAMFLVIRTIQFTTRPAGRVVAVLIALLMIVPTFFVVRQLTYHPYDWQPFAADWEPGQGDEFAKALSEGRPVLFEFTADWCGNCHALEAFVLNNRRVASALNSKKVVMVKADVTKSTAPARGLLGKLNPVGAIPLTAIYSPHQADPILLSGIYSREELKAAVDRAASGLGSSARASVR